MIKLKPSLAMRSLATLIIVFLVACSDSTPHDSNNNHEHSALTSSVGPSEMSLNNDQKWMMDEHTRLAFSTMVSSFFSVNHAALNKSELQAIGSQLQSDIDSLIQGCTMTEEPHHQLHLFLTAYIPTVDSLIENGQLENAKEVAYHLNNYSYYFQ